MTFSSKFQTLLRKKRRQRRLLEAGQILAVILCAQYYQKRDLRERAVPPLAGVLIYRSAARVGAGDTAILLAFLSAQGRNVRCWWPESFQA